MTYPSGRQLDFTLNTIGQISAISTTASGANQTAQSLVSNGQYLPFGPTSSFAYGNGLLNTLSYNHNYQLTAQTLTGLKNQQLLYSATGNITAITDANTESQQTFAYDPLSRLQSAAGTYGDLAYSYDAIGNRLSKTANTSNTNTVVTQYDYLAGSHHLGNISIGDIVQKNSQFSHFNQARRMSTLVDANTTTHYRYNWQGLRTSKSNQQATTHYHYGPGGLLIAESDAQGSWQKEYIYFNGRLIAMIDYSTASAQTYYAHNDHLGTPKLLTNSQAKPVWQASYTPFGLAEINADVNQDGQTVTLNIRFAGQYYDVESGLHYNWFRYYDPTIGRYVTSDPIGLAGGINTYGYVGGNPVGFVDPIGLDAQVTIWQPSGWGGSSFGHASISINGKTWTFGPKGMSLRSTKSYYIRNSFRSGITSNIPLSIEQDKQLIESLNGNQGSYNSLFNNCTSPIQKGLKRVDIDTGDVILPVSLGNTLIDLGVIDGITFQPQTKPSEGTSAPWAR
jgi:RHS repeat-associated protein